MDHYLKAKTNYMGVQNVDIFYYPSKWRKCSAWVVGERG